MLQVHVQDTNLKKIETDAVELFRLICNSLQAKRLQITERDQN